MEDNIDEEFPELRRIQRSPEVVRSTKNLEATLKRIREKEEDPKDVGVEGARKTICPILSRDNITQVCLEKRCALWVFEDRREDGLYGGGECGLINAIRR